MPLTPDEELQLIDAEIAIKEKSQKSTPSVIKAGVNAIPGVGPALDLTSHFSKLPPEAQKAAMTAIGAEVGLPGGALASGAGAAVAGGLTEAAQNPSTAAKVMAPMIKTMISPTPETVAEVIKNINKPETKDFMKRRGVEAGTAATLGAGMKALRGVTAQGPISAAIENPSLVSKTVRGRILNELGLTKGAARVGEDTVEASRLRRMLGVGPAGKLKLAEEAVDAVKTGKNLSNTQLLAYEEALGKVQTKGGTFSNDYAVARTAIRKQMQKQAPTLLKAKIAARKVFMSEGSEDTSSSLVDAINNFNPKGLVDKITSSPTLGRQVGAVTRIGAEAAFPASISASDALANMLQKYSKRYKGR